MKTTPENQTINILVDLFDAMTGWKHDDWTLDQILAWFDGYKHATKERITNENRD